MPEVETEVRRYAEAVIAAVQPVTAEEARARSTKRRPLTRPPRLLIPVAAVTALFGVAGVLATVDRSQNDGVTVAAEVPPDFPLTVDGQRDWLMALVNQRHQPSDDEIESRFTESFLAEVSRERILALASAAHGARVLREVERRENVLAVQLVAGIDEQFRLNFSLAPDGRMASLLLLGAVPCADLVDPASVQVPPELQARLDWLIEIVNSSRELSDEEIVGTLTPSFLKAVPPAEFRAMTYRMRSTLAPITIRAFEGPPRPRSLSARVGVRTGEEARLMLSIESDGPHRITGAQILTQQPCQLPAA